MKLASLIEHLMRAPRHATTEDIRKAFGDYHNVLHWLALFLTGDKELADNCIVDACTVAKNQSPLFHEWLIHWAARATVECALRLQQATIHQLAEGDETAEPAEHTDPPLSREEFNLLVEHTDEVRERLDVLSRFALVLCGIARDGRDKVAAQLGVSQASVQRTYLAALEVVRHIPAVG